ncbi:tetratricopeptide repeat protein [Sphaerisporangium aureirubrum]|uniref:tetratricopeptide repeat protein n=1 Tax=Sphaerisporangium aureirubrum TaxID=1544736 RepID=UPI00362ED0F7
MSGGRWQEHRVLIAVVVLAGLGATSAVVTAFKVTSPWVIGAAVVGVAVAGVLSGFVQERYKRLSVRRDENALKVQDGCLVLANGRLPKVAQIDDPVRLGVHPALVLASVTGTQPPAYVPRDVDEAVRERLAEGGFVLLVGDSTAGKSRTAFEAMRTTVPEHLLIAPHDRTALPAAIEHAARADRCVLWLSDLEHYLGTAGLTREHIARLTTDSKGHRIILATLRSAEQARLTSPPNDGDQSVRSAAREIHETLEQAAPVRLVRMFSPAEVDRARLRTWDPRIASAVDKAKEFGIAEYLASGPELQRDLDNAWDIGANPRGAALVVAAIDCRRAGYTSPAPRKLLEHLHTDYLNAMGGHRLQPESLDQAWQWATRPRRATTALLTAIQGPDNDQVVVFDYLVDLAQQQQGPLAHVAETVIRTALTHVTIAEDADQIATTAQHQGRYHLTETAQHLSLTLRRRVLGEDHPSTLTSRDNLAFVLWALGRLEEAEAEHRAVLAVRRRVLGEDHPSTLMSRDNLAGVLRDLGRQAEAEAEHRAVLAVRRQVLGEDHPSTLTSRNNLANVLNTLGRLEEAEAEHRAVLAVRRRVLGEDHPSTLMSRDNLAVMRRDLGRQAEAEAEHRAVLAVRRQVLGEDHPDTLMSRENLAVVLRALGRLEEAEAEHRAVLAVRRRVLGEDHPSTLTSRDNLAVVLWALGRLEEAEAEHRAVLAVRRRVLGEDHPSSLMSRENLAVVLRDLGRQAEAEHRAL